ncbi:polysialyltransferase family glycosyltransferase [Chryseobacterium sp. SC28]|uniref:polysialyltransferase family glycosyltransferase n=1 Tax=Chryseobacterium sp. SC28 TaxID=2268028 RepID=UPI000F6507F6|nr:polysialyltransferase family glycosyltransferase [Chryseobacterium sp. SC28]RRQ45840.1 hypothetical protein DTW91_07945 [Chryseobacterium sp. SC28]
MNIAAINGSWQTITFLNFYMVEYGRDPGVGCDVVLFEVDDQLKETCIKILNRFSFIRNISTLDNMLILPYENLWIGKLFSQGAKFIANKYEKLPIILFEEGLHSYIDPKKFKIKYFLGRSYPLKYKVWASWNYLLGNNILQWDKNFTHLVFEEHENRIKKKYFLTPLVKKSKKVIVNSVHLNFVIDKINDLQSTPMPNNRTKATVLIVGQCFSNYDLMPFEEELDLYVQLIGYFLGREYEVIWKGHPRSKLFDKAIKSIYKDLSMLDNSMLPLEVFTYNNKTIELAGVSSSSLLYHKILHGGKTTQIAHLFIEKFNKNNKWYSDFNDMCKLIDANIDRIELNITK